MKTTKDLVLGIDTSNYTTSLALTDKEGIVIADERQLLTVKQGSRGLRQSEALYQHNENLPRLLTAIFDRIDQDRIGAVAVSSRPRPVEGSYMPVFKSGINYGNVIGTCLSVPVFEFSHQEGHLEAILRHSPLEASREYLAYHLSGGTCELLHVRDGAIEVVGGSKDISFGQAIDRAGVALHLQFPAGAEMDRIAAAYGAQMKERSEKSLLLSKEQGRLSKIPFDGLYFNLSGIETQFLRKIEACDDTGALAYELFMKISDALAELSQRAVVAYQCTQLLFTGGVSASSLIRERMEREAVRNGWNIAFGNPCLSSDNGVGISYLGGNQLWHLNR